MTPGASLHTHLSFNNICSHEVKVQKCVGATLLTLVYRKTNPLSQTRSLQCLQNVLKLDIAISGGIAWGDGGCLVIIS